MNFWRMKKKDFFILAVLISILITFISYPGYFYFADSYQRWEQALLIVDGRLSEVTNWYSLVPQFVMAFCYVITENYATYTFLQSVIFLFTTYYVIDILLDNFQMIAILLISIFPPIIIRCVQMETAVGAIVGMNIFIICLVKNNNIKPKTHLKEKSSSIIYLLTLFLAGVIVFGYRQNAITILPIIILFLLKEKNNWKTFYMRSVVVLLSALFVMGIPTFFGISKCFDVSGIGVLWDNISALEHIADKEKYEGYLDWLGTPGCTRDAININNQNNMNGFAEKINPALATDISNASRLKKKYLQLCFDEPMAVIKSKMIRSSYILGISTPLADNDIRYNDLEKMQSLGMRDSNLRHEFMNNYQKFTNSFVIMRMPWLNFIIVAIISLYSSKLMEKKEKSNVLLLYSLSIFYYGAFIINAQSCEFRYFYPAYYLLIILLIYDFSMIISKKIMK